MLPDLKLHLFRLAYHRTWQILNCRKQLSFFCFFFMFIDTLSNYFAPEQFFWNAIFPAEYILRAIRSHTILTRCLLVLCFMDLTSYESSAMSDSNFVLNLQRFTNLLKITNLQRSLKVHKHPTIHAYLRNSNLRRSMNLQKFIFRD